MVIYIIIFIAITGVALIELFASKKVMRPVFWAFVIFLILFVGLRGENVGFDYESYKLSFQYIGQGDTNILMEPGYVLLNRVLYPVGCFSVVLFVMALLSISIKGQFMARYSPYPFTSLLVYFCIALLINDMGQMRFGMAISFMLLSYSAMIDNRKLWVWLFFGLAMMFHYSSLLVVPVLFFYNYRFSTKQMIFGLLFGFCFYAISINTILNGIAGFLPSYLGSKIQFYTFYADTYGQALGLNISLLLRLFILGLFVYYKPTIEKQCKGINVFFNLYLYGVIIYMVFNSNAEFATRGSAYFKILELVILPMIISVGKTKTDKILIWFAVVAYAFYSLSKIVFDVEFGGAYHNYTNILFGG